MQKVLLREKQRSAEMMKYTRKHFICWLIYEKILKRCQSMWLNNMICKSDFKYLIWFDPEKWFDFIWFKQTFRRFYLIWHYFVTILFDFKSHFLWIATALKTYMAIYAYTTPLDLTQSTVSNTQPSPPYLIYVYWE